jgi:hypothetical protein
MGAKQLAELKDHMKELLENGYIRPSSPPFESPYDFFVPKNDWYSKDVRVLSFSK